MFCLRFLRMNTTRKDLRFSVRNFFDFTGKKYLVTGASSGIGRAVAVELARQGACVALNGRNIDRLNDTAGQIQELGGKCQVLPLDLAGTENLSGMFDEIVSDGVKLDGLVHCAGVAVIRPLAMLNRAVMDETMHVNFYAFIELVKQASKKKYRAERMSIAAISAIGSLNPRKCQTIYTASKAALNNAIQALAVELADKNIRINGVITGPVDTEMSRRSEDSGQLPTPIQTIYGTMKPEQIANAAMYLLSDASDTMTGRYLFADGGAII